LIIDNLGISIFSADHVGVLQFFFDNPGNIASRFIDPERARDYRFLHKSSFSNRTKKSINSEMKLLLGLFSLISASQMMLVWNCPNSNGPSGAFLESIPDCPGALQLQAPISVSSKMIFCCKLISENSAQV
jgi:hypothetical protein